MSVVEVDGFRFLLHRQVTREKKKTTVRFGIPRHGTVRHALSCVTFLVYPREDSIALDWVGYRPYCSEPDLPEIGGSVAMLRAAIRAVFEMFPRQRGRSPL